MNDDHSLCEVPGCTTGTESYIDLWNCYHMFYFCNTHLLTFVNVLYEGHTGHCAQCGKEFREGNVGIIVEKAV